MKTSMYETYMFLSDWKSVTYSSQIWQKQVYPVLSSSMILSNNLPYEYLSLPDSYTTTENGGKIRKSKDFIAQNAFTQFSQNGKNPSYRSLSDDIRCFLALSFHLNNILIFYHNHQLLWTILEQSPPPFDQIGWSLSPIMVSNQGRGPIKTLQ